MILEQTLGNGYVKSHVPWHVMVCCNCVNRFDHGGRPGSKLV